MNEFPEKGSVVSPKLVNLLKMGVGTFSTINASRPHLKLQTVTTVLPPDHFLILKYAEARSPVTQQISRHRGYISNW